MERTLRRELPNYAAWKALRSAHLRDRRKVLLDRHPRFRGRLDWGGNGAPIDPLTAFTAPFPPFDVGVYGDSAWFEDKSYVWRKTGQLVGDVACDHDDFDVGMEGVFGVTLPCSAHSRASCGVVYTMPRAGRRTCRPTRRRAAPYRLSGR